MIRKAFRISERMNLELNLRRSYAFILDKDATLANIRPLSLSPFESSLPLI